MLKEIADRRRVSIANLVLRDPRSVRGSRSDRGDAPGVAEHIEENQRVFGLSLNTEELASIDAVWATSRDLTAVIGDCGDEYR